MYVQKYMCMCIYIYMYVWKYVSDTIWVWQIPLGYTHGGLDRVSSSHTYLQICHRTSRDYT